MPKDAIIAGLDIGSNAIRLVVGQRVGQDQEARLQIVAAIDVPARGISKGVINSIEDAVSAVSSCLEKAERMIGAPIEQSWIGISGHHIYSQYSKGVVAVSKSDGEITRDDIDRAIEAAQTVATPPNYEILHVIPKSFSIDDQSGIKDPLGMSGVRLEVDVQIIQGLRSQIKNLTKAVYRTGLDIEDLVLSILASAEVLLTSRQQELGVALINIGATTTSLAVFEEGDLIHVAVIPIGSDHITSDIAIGLRTSIDVAERVKVEYGICVSKEVSKKDEINLKDVDGEDVMVSKRYISEIIDARVEEIFDKVDEELKKIDKSGMLPAGVVLTGGGSRLGKIVEVAKNRLRLPASLGKVSSEKIVATVDKVTEPEFSTALGLVLWGDNVSQQRHTRFGQMISRFKTVDEITNKMKKWIKSLTP